MLVLLSAVAVTAQHFILWLRGCENYQEKPKSMDKMNK